MPVYHVTNQYNEGNDARTTAAASWIVANCPSLIERVSSNNLQTSVHKFGDINDANRWINYSLNTMSPAAAASAITLTE